MLDCFRPSKGVDPQVFASAIIGILLRYPATVVEEVTSPVVGLASRQEFMPSPYDVRQACEALMRPLREITLRQRREVAQLAERGAEDFAREPAAVRREAVRRAQEMPRKPLTEPADALIDPATGRHPPGTILTNYDAAVRLYGKPIDRSDPRHSSRLK